MTRTRTSLAVLGLVATCLGTVAAGPASAHPAADGPTAPHKPFSAGSVSLDASDIDDGYLTATSTPLPGLAEPRVIFDSTGDAEVTGTDDPIASERSTVTVTATIEVDAGDEPADPAEAAVADASATTVIATLRANDATGVVRTASDRVWVDEFQGHTLVSAVGEQDLRLQRVAVLEADGTVTAEEADVLRQQVRGGGATTATSTEGAVCAEVCVSGTIQWTDSEGGLHPVDRATVQVWDEDGATDVQVGSPTPATAVTGADGTYAIANLPNDDGDATGYDLFIRVLAGGPGFTLAHHIDSVPVPDVADGTDLMIDLTAGNTLDSNTAFSVHAALVVAHDQVAQLRGSPLAPIPVVFPDPDGSFYDGDALHLLGPDRFDWDVALHEFGHYVTDTLNIENSPGGPHSFSQNLSDARGSKVVGTRLAWGEGWPTYFAVSTLFEDAAGLGVPDVGDSRYQDTEDATIDVSLEAKATLGEDNERTVMNALWDLYDAHDDGRDTITLGAQSIWDTLDAGDPVTLSAAYALFSPNRRREAVNCVFTDMNVAPRLDGPAVVDPSFTRPTLRWRRGNGGSHRNDSFSVTFRSATGVLLYASPFRNGQSYTPTGDRWVAIKEHSGGTVRVSVVGRQLDAPTTGPYRSCTKAFVLA